VAIKGMYMTINIRSLIKKRKERFFDLIVSSDN